MSEKDVKTKTRIVSRYDSDNVLFKSEKETIKEAVIEAVNAKAYLSGADLSGAYLRGACLRGADLSEIGRASCRERVLRLV